MKELALSIAVPAVSARAAEAPSTGRAVRAWMRKLHDGRLPDARKLPGRGE
jgi:hypothetical protein